MFDKNPCPEPKPHRQTAESTTSFPTSAACKARFFFGHIWTITHYAFHMTYISMGFTSPACMKRTLFFLLSYNKNVCYWMLKCVQHVADICGVLLSHFTCTTKWAISPSKINPALFWNTSYFRNAGAKQHTSANTEHIKGFKEVLFHCVLLRCVSNNTYVRISFHLSIPGGFSQLFWGFFGGICVCFVLLSLILFQQNLKLSLRMQAILSGRQFHDSTM